MDYEFKETTDLLQTSDFSVKEGHFSSHSSLEIRDTLLELFVGEPACFIYLCIYFLHAVLRYSSY